MRGREREKHKWLDVLAEKMNVFFHSAVQQTIPMSIINFHLRIEVETEIIIL